MSIEVLHCVVTSDWVKSSVVARESHLLLPQGTEPLLPHGLWYEYAILRKLLYKNKSQHRKTKYFQHLQDVDRQMRLLQSTQCEDLCMGLVQAVQQGLANSGLPTVSMHRTLGHEQRVLPSFQSAAFTLRRLHAAASIISKLIEAIQGASRRLMTELSHAYFVPLTLTVLSILARIWVLGCQAELNLIQAYNALISIAPGLPISLNKSMPPAAFPASLVCSWRTPGVPRPVPGVSSDADTSLESTAQHTTDRFLLQPVPASDADTSQPTQFLSFVEDARVEGGVVASEQDLGVILKRDDDEEETKTIQYEYVSAQPLGSGSNEQNLPVLPSKPEPTMAPAKGQGSVMARPPKAGQIGTSSSRTTAAFLAVPVGPRKGGLAGGNSTELAQNRGLEEEKGKKAGYEVADQPLLLSLESKKRKKNKAGPPKLQSWEDWLDVPAGAGSSNGSANKKRQK